MEEETSEETPPLLPPPARPASPRVGPLVGARGSDRLLILPLLTPRRLTTPIGPCVRLLSTPLLLPPFLLLRLLIATTATRWLPSPLLLLRLLRRLLLLLLRVLTNTDLPWPAPPTTPIFVSASVSWNCGTFCRANAFRCAPNRDRFDKADRLLMAGCTPPSGIELRTPPSGF